MTTTEPIQQVLPENLYNQLIEDVAASGAATESFVENFRFYGKTLKDHSLDLWVEIPDKVTPEEYRTIFTRLGRNIQTASHYYSMANSINHALAGGGSQKKADIMRAISQSYEARKLRRPGQDLISSMADSYMSNTNNVSTASKIVKDFWKHKLDALIEIRKTMEQIGISMMSEIKYMER